MELKDDCCPFFWGACTHHRYTAHQCTMSFGHGGVHVCQHCGEVK